MRHSTVQAFQWDLVISEGALLDIISVCSVCVSHSSVNRATTHHNKCYNYFVFYKFYNLNMPHMPWRSTISWSAEIAIEHW